MVGEDPIQKGDEAVIADSLPRGAGAPPEARLDAIPVVTPQPLGGRRISFVAWGLAAVAGIAIWILIFDLI